MFVSLCVVLRDARNGSAAQVHSVIFLLLLFKYVAVEQGRKQTVTKLPVQPH